MISALALSTMTFGQVLQKPTPAPFKDLAEQPKVPVSNSSKASGEVFWSCTFNWGNVDTKAWTLPDGWEIKDNTDLGNTWMWRSPYDTLGGCCTKQGPSPNFATPLDGYIVLPSDEYNHRDGIGTNNAMDSYFQTCPIDCSGKTTVTVKFKQLFRLCCSTNTLQMLVTNDGGVHWATYDCLFGLGNNRVTDARYQNIEFNITDVAAGYSNVQLRFYQTGNADYFWMIDDLTVSEAYQNDLILADYWCNFNGGKDEGIGHVCNWPLSQMGMASEVAGTIGEYSFKGAFLNNGAADQENVKLQMTVLKNGNQVYQDVSDAKSIWTLERDTSTVNSVFLANDYGDYQFNYAAISDNAEEIPANNTVQQSFTVNDTLMHRADFTANSASNTGGWTDGANAGDMIGVHYDVFKPCELDAITAYIYGVTEAEDPTFQYVLLKNIDDSWEEIITSDLVNATADQKGNYITLDVQKDGETEFLEPGKYIACVRMWGTAAGDDNGTNGISVGWDTDNNQSNYTYMYLSKVATSYESGKLNMIGMVLNETGGPTQAPVTWNINMTKHIASGEFHPATDVVALNGLSDSWNGTVVMTDPDGDGIYSVTVEGLKVASELHYKYSINGALEAYPTSGNPYRRCTVRYWNIVNSGYYNGGITSGIDENNLVAVFNVYPNPTTGAFTVQINNSTPSDLVISLTNIQGQVIFRNTVKNTINYQETIDNNLAKGLYFLSVNNGKEVKVQKVVVE